jgi:arginase
MSHTILVPYHHSEAITALSDAFTANDAVIVSKGPAGAMVTRIYDMLAKRVAERDEPVVVISGDCTTALGTIAGLQRRGVSPGVIWLDAHADFHTAHSTRSGYLSGMALAMITGRTGVALRDAIGMTVVDDASCVIAGARDIDDGERENLAASRVRVMSLDELDAASDLPPGPWYVHVATCLFDAPELPATRHPVPGGPSLERVTATLRGLAARGTIAALGIGVISDKKALQAAGRLDALRPLIDAIRFTAP